MAIDMFSKPLQQVDVIITPHTLCLTNRNRTKKMDLNRRKEHPRMLARLTGPINTLGFPSISVPGGFASNHMSVGIQFIGAPFDEKTLYQVSSVLEQSV